MVEEVVVRLTTVIMFSLLMTYYTAYCDDIFSKNLIFMISKGPYYDIRK